MSTTLCEICSTPSSDLSGLLLGARMMDLANLKNLILIPTILIYVLKKGERPQWYLILGAVLIFSTLTEALAWTLLRLSIPNLSVYNIYTVVNTLLVTSMLSAVYDGSRRFIPWSATVLISAILVHQVYYGAGLEAFAAGLVVVSGFIIAAYAGYMLYRVAESTELAIGREGIFWILAAYLIYYLCFAPSIGLVGYLIAKDPGTAITLLNFNDVLFVLHFIMIMIGIRRLNFSIPQIAR